MDRFVSACQADERVVAAFLGGSYASGKADGSSDVDLGLITADAAYDSFVASKRDFVSQLGEPLFLEDFGSPRHAFAIFADGTEADFSIGREGAFRHIHFGPYRVLMDRSGVLDGAEFTWRQPDEGEQTERLRELVYWFWHEMSHLVKALERGQLWWAEGQLESLRGMCVSLARLGHNFADPDVGSEPYFKVERALPGERLEPLRPTVGALTRDSLIRSARDVTDFYHDVVPALAREHGIAYPDRLEAIFLRRIEALTETGR